MATEFFRRKIEGQPDQLINRQTGEAIGPTAFGGGEGFTEVAAPQMATLVKGDQRQAVEVGSQQAQELFGQGFSLEQSAPDIPDDGVTDTGDLSGDITTDGELEKLFQEQARLRDTFLEAIQNTGVRSDEEIALQEQLGGVQSQLREAQTRNLEAVQGLEGQGRGIVSGIVRGQQARLQKQQAIALQDLRNEETNLIARLGLEKEAREAQQQAALAGAETALGFIAEDVELLQKLEDRHQEQLDNLREEREKLTDDARKNLSLIIESASGLLFEELSEETQRQIFELANTSNIPTDVVSNALKVAKDDIVLQETKQRADIARINRANIDSGTKSLDPTDPANAKFISATKAGVANLQKGEKWGTVFDRIKQQFPNIPDDAIDTALGIEWRKEGAFEEFKQKQYKEAPARQFELEAGVWSWLGTPSSEGGGADLPRDEQRQAIMAAGFNPEDFNIY